MKLRIMLILMAVVLALVFFVLAEFLIVKYNGSPVSAPEIPRGPKVLGSGPALTYVVMGDSTSIGQGTNYDHSYALASAEQLAANHKVKFVNVGISGATAKSVLDIQLPQAIKYKPDIVLLAVGANDATHFTSGNSIQMSLQQIIDGLKQANCDVRIVVTGSPAMDSVTRFPWPLKQLMGLRTKQVNAAFSPIIKRNNLTLAPIAIRTRAAFLADPTLLAADKFHPDARGYALWIPVVNQALDQALKAPAPADCPKP
ncbi:MAG TPA: SGNH/GDSL hydrolase family protein [Candidatus Dormibacteraeota bacterium]|nr:SGNH/GDSL hydrolase family protein [Candidatus Dormibacteraeota bacterium]